MKELVLTDAELSRLIAGPIMTRLKSAGFKTGMRSDEQCTVFLPVNLDLVGQVTVSRHEDGTWSFVQELDSRLTDRMEFAQAAHAAAVEGREGSACR